MTDKSLEQLKAEQLYYEAMAEHGFDPNAKVWVVNPEKFSVGKAPISNKYDEESAVKAIEKTINILKFIDKIKKD